VAKVDEVSVVAVVNFLAAVPFANELGGETRDRPVGLSFREEAQSATGVVMAEFRAWGLSAMHWRIPSGSPAAEIVKAANEFDADLILLPSGSGGLSDTILLGSTAQRVQYSAPCPVLVSHPRH